MTILWDLPLNDPEDIDDAEHAHACNCAECDPDFQMDLRRELRWDAERSA